MLGTLPTKPDTVAHETDASERRATEVVRDTERRLGYIPRDVSHQRPAYDIESAIPGTGKLRFVEVKGQAAGATTATVISNGPPAGGNGS
ncbi:MAG TPA: DUF3883 domain-containing protein, partial [Planctomycetaceae bacterium]|nr:DUF3883 domain-containing protein [Planctomycetaceae bacterium]